MDFSLFNLVVSLSILTSTMLLLKAVFHNRKHCPLAKGGYRNA